MENSKAPKGRFTIFHFWWGLAVFIGLGCGIGFGAARFSWLGGLLGRIAGLMIGVIVGWLPWFLAFTFLSHSGSKREQPEKIGS